MPQESYVAVTGYYCTGSSAIIDLLKEYNNVSIASPIDSDYEHMAFYTQGALYDLSSILLSDNRSAYGSDMAINGFLDAAKRLNDNDFGWYGSYKKYYGNQYMEAVQTFINTISYKKDRRSAAHTKYVRFSLIKAVMQIIAKILYKRPITSFGKKFVFDDKDSYFSMPTREEFCEAAKHYTQSYLKMCSKEAEINLFDHLLWPQQTDSIFDFMPDALKVIVVDRDPRDLYLLNKYYWHRPPVSTSKPYYPTEPAAFISEWRRTVSRNIENDRVLVIHFEDLIYNYRDTVLRIEAFLDIDDKNHSAPYSKFEPERSIENTQVFTLSEEWKREVEQIAHELEDYLYPFPYVRIPDKKLWFDTDLQLIGVKEKKKIVR